MILLSVDVGFTNSLSYVCNSLHPFRSRSDSLIASRSTRPQVPASNTSLPSTTTEARPEDTIHKVVTALEDDNTRNNEPHSTMLVNNDGVGQEADVDVLPKPEVNGGTEALLAPASAPPPLILEDEGKREEEEDQQNEADLPNQAPPEPTQAPPAPSQPPSAPILAPLTQEQVVGEGVGAVPLAGGHIGEEVMVQPPKRLIRWIITRVCPLLMAICVLTIAQEVRCRPPCCT